MKCFYPTESIQNGHNRVASMHAYVHHPDFAIFLVICFDFVVIFLIFKDLMRNHLLSTAAPPVRENKAEVV